MRAPLRGLLLAALLLAPLASAQTVAPTPPSAAAKTAPAAGPARGDGQATTPAPSAAPPAKTDPSMDEAARQARARGLLDVNSASEEELRKLPGVNAAVARRIIAGRPYAQTSLLLSKKIVAKGVYDRIKDQVVAAQPRD